LARVEVYCDASVSPALMDGVQSSKLGTNLVARVAILIPQLDYGLIEQLKEGAVDLRGNPASTQLEIIAVQRAKKLCIEKNLFDYVILTDNQSAVDQSNVAEVQWLAPGRKHLASLFLQRVMNRARYLRQSDRKIVNRPPPNILQEEMYRVFRAERVEFRLSESNLWKKIQMEMTMANTS
jgi:hypothetical protein